MGRTLDRRDVLRLGAVVWAVPALTSVGVAEAVGSPAPAGGTAMWVPVDSDQVLHAGSATVSVWSGYVRFGDEGMTAFPPHIGDDRVVLAGDPLGATGPRYAPGVFFVPWSQGSAGEWHGPGDGAAPEVVHWTGSAASWGHYSWAVKSPFPSPPAPVALALSWGDVWLVRQRLT